MKNVEYFENRGLNVQTIPFSWTRTQGISPVTNEPCVKDVLVSVTPDGPVYRIFGQEMEEGYSSFFATKDGEIIFELDVSALSYRRAFQLMLGTMRQYLKTKRSTKARKRSIRHGNA